MITNFSPAFKGTVSVDDKQVARTSPAIDLQLLEKVKEKMDLGAILNITRGESFGSFSIAPTHKMNPGYAYFLEVKPDSVELKQRIKGAEKDTGTSWLIDTKGKIVDETVQKVSELGTKIYKAAMKEMISREVNNELRIQALEAAEKTSKDEVPQNFPQIVASLLKNF